MRTIKENKIVGELVQPDTAKTNSPFTKASTEVRKSLSSLVEKHKVIVGFSALIALAILYPNESFSASLEETLTGANELMMTKVKTWGLTGATLGGGAMALFKGNMKLCGCVIGIGVCLGYMLKWIEGGMTL